MNITKLVHSCVLVETPDRVALFDPGAFSWKSGLVDLVKINRVDRIVVTHPHADHLHPEFISALLAKFPSAQVVGNSAVQSMLDKAHIKTTVRESTACSVKFSSDHAEVAPFGQHVANNGYHFQEKFTHPGDTHDIAETKEVLAMPFVAPWGTIMDAIDKVVELKPKKVLPIHDWFYSADAQDWLYERIAQILIEYDIELLPHKSGEVITID